MIVGSCPACGKTLYHDSRFVRDEFNAWCPDHAPERPGTPPVETCHGSCTPGREAVPLARERPVVSKGLNEQLLANEKPHETLDYGKELTGEDIDRMMARLAERNRAQPVVLHEPRSSAAERLARLVLGTIREGDEYVGAQDAVQMLAEARKVLGEKP